MEFTGMDLRLSDIFVKLAEIDLLLEPVEVGQFSMLYIFIMCMDQARLTSRQFQQACGE